jgi:hypothetical protein
MNYDCVLLEEESCIKHITQYKEKEDGGIGTDNKCTSSPGQHVLSERLKQQGWLEQGQHKEWTIIKYTEEPWTPNSEAAGAWGNLTLVDVWWGRRFVEF